MFATTHSTARTPSRTPSSLEARPDQPTEWIASAREGIRFEDAAARILSAAARDGVRTDEIIDVRGWMFGSTDHQTMQLAQVIGGTSEPLALRKTAFAQLAARANVPTGYLQTLPEKLQVACMNWGLATMEDRHPMQMRRAGNEIRALVSDRYAAMDDETVLEIVDDALNRAGLRDDAMVRSTVTGTNTLLRITIPSGAVQVKVGDVIEWGVDIANSELGLRSVQVTPSTYRLICTNGMRAAQAESTLRLRHVGDPIRLRDSLRAVVPTAFAEARGDIARWKRSVDVMIDDALMEIDGLRGFGLGAGETRQIGRTLLGLPENTGNDELAKHLKQHRTNAFDLANAMTQTARDRADVAARLSLEETAHRYLVRRAG